jgi:hypothetical protein
MKKIRKVSTLFFAGIFALSGFLPLTSSASEVNTALAANPAATLSAIDAMNLAPLSDEQASKVQGEFIPWVVVYGTFYTGVALGIAWYKLAPYALSCAQNCSNIYELGSAYYDAAKILKSSNPGNRKCIYSGTANSTAMYCS